MENTKKCTKCLIEKHHSDFYFNKSRNLIFPSCKSCISVAQKVYMEKNMKDKDFRYNRNKNARNRHKNNDYIAPKNPESSRISVKKWCEKYPEKKSAGFSSMQFKSEKGFNKHHWSYNKIHWRDWIDLTVKDHKKAHIYIVYDQERMMYRRYDTNELLDTKEKHKSFIEYCIKNLPD